MKNITLKKVLLGTVVSVGLATPLVASNTNVVPFCQTAVVQAAARKITLKHNAYLYNYRGHRVGRRKLYRHHSYRYYSVKYIHGKKYYRVGKNRYVKASNVAKLHSHSVKRHSSVTTTSTSTGINTNGMGTPKFQVKINGNNVDIYSASHTTANGSWTGTMPLHGTYNVYAEDNNMYEIGKNQWINENDVDSVINSSSSNNNRNANTETSQVENSNTQSSTSSNVSSNNHHKTSNIKHNKNKDAISGNLTENQRQEVIQYFVELINKARQENGAQPLSLDTSLSSESQQRAIHDGNILINTGDEDCHQDENGNSLLPNDAGGEVEAGIMVYPGDNAKKLAQFAYNQFMVNDADQGWAHKKNLLNPSWTTIGVGVYFAKGTDNYNFGSLVADLK